MTIYKAISQAKAKLKRKAETSGIYENFGQKEVRKLREYIDLGCYTQEENAKRQALESFDDWCSTYNGIERS